VAGDRTQYLVGRQRSMILRVEFGPGLSREVLLTETFFGDPRVFPASELRARLKGTVGLG